MTINDVEQYAAERGIVLTPAQRAKIAEAQAAERQRLMTIAPADERQTWADKWALFYPRLLRAVSAIGDTIITFSKTAIVALGVPVMLVLVLIVEHHRVKDGISLFEVVPSMADLGAWVIVLANLVLEFVIHYEETRHKWTAPANRRASLRLWWQNAAYRLGIGDEWRPIAQSPAHRYKRLLSLVTFAALGLALAGSMRSAIQSQTGAWHEALGAIVANSSLAEMSTWMGGLLFALAAVLVAQGLSRYVAIRAVEIVATMDATQTERLDPYAAAVEQAGAIMAQAIVADALAKRAARQAPKEQKAEASTPLNPFGSTAHAQDAHEFIPMTAPQIAHEQSAITSANGNGHKT